MASIATRYKKYIDRQAKTRQELNELSDILKAEKMELFRYENTNRDTLRQRQLRLKTRIHINELERKIKEKKGLLVRLEILETDALVS